MKWIKQSNTNKRFVSIFGSTNIQTFSLQLQYMKLLGLLWQADHSYIGILPAVRV
jgi:hypothetical protein